MPYSKLSEANAAIRGIKPPVTLSQANAIAAAADAMAGSDNAPESPWAVAISQFKKSHTVRDGKWVSREEHETQKAMSAIGLDMDDMAMAHYVAIAKVSGAGAAEDEQIIEAYGSTESIDGEDEIVDTEGVREALPDYLEWSNLREMHQLSAVGKVLKAEIIDGDVTMPNGKVIHNPLYVVAKVYDKDAWDKVKNEIYKGLSIGGKALAARRERVNGKSVVRITKLRITEISLVDRPANPDARIIMWKGARIMPENETVAQTPTTSQAADTAPVEQVSAPAPVKPSEETNAAWKTVSDLAKAAGGKGKVKSAIAALQEARDGMELAGNTDGADYLSGAIKLAAMAMTDQSVDLAGGEGDGDPIEQEQQGAAAEESGATGSAPAPEKPAEGEGGGEAAPSEEDKKKEGERYKAVQATLGEVARSTLAKLATGNPLAARALGILDGKVEAPVAQAPAVDVAALTESIAKAVQAQLAPIAERQDILAKAISALPTPGGPRQRLTPIEKTMQTPGAPQPAALPAPEAIEAAYQSAIDNTSDPTVKQALQQDRAKMLYLRGHIGQ